MVFKLFWDQSWVENVQKQTKFEVFQAKEMQQNKKSRPQRWSFQSESRLEELSSGSRAEHEAALIWKHSTRLSGWKNKNRSYVLLCLLSWVTLSPCLSLCSSSSSFCFDTKRRRKTNSEVFWLSAAASTNPETQPAHEATTRHKGSKTIGETFYRANFSVHSECVWRSSVLSNMTQVSLVWVGLSSNYNFFFYCKCKKCEISAWWANPPQDQVKLKWARVLLYSHM